MFVTWSICWFVCKITIWCYLLFSVYCKANGLFLLLSISSCRHYLMCPGHCTISFQVTYRHPDWQHRLDDGFWQLRGGWSSQYRDELEPWKQLEGKREPRWLRSSPSKRWSGDGPRTKTEMEKTDNILSLEKTTSIIFEIVKTSKSSSRHYETEFSQPSG